MVSICLLGVPKTGLQSVKPSLRGQSSQSEFCSRGWDGQHISESFAIDLFVPGSNFRWRIAVISNKAYAMFEECGMFFTYEAHDLLAIKYSNGLTLISGPATQGF